MGNINEFVSGALKCSHEITKNPDPDSFYMHAHDVCEIYIFINGNAQYYVEGNVYNLQENDIMIMRQGETHKLQINSDCIYNRMSIHFSPDMICNNISKELIRPFYKRALGRMNLYRKEDFDDEFYLACVCKIKRIIDEKKDNHYIIAPLIALLSEIFKAYEKRNIFEEKTPLNNIAMDMVEYINRHISDELRLESIAEHFFISSSQANRIFKKSVGTSVWEYVVIKRLMAAKDMILSGTNASSAAEKCGFSDYSSFYRAYRKRYGVSPKHEKQK